MIDVILQDSSQNHRFDWQNATRATVANIMDSRGWASQSVMQRRNSKDKVGRHSRILKRRLNAWYDAMHWIFQLRPPCCCPSKAATGLQTAQQRGRAPAARIETAPAHELQPTHNRAQAKSINPTNTMKWTAKQIPLKRWLQLRSSCAGLLYGRDEA